MTVALVLVLIAFVAPSSAYEISNGNVEYTDTRTMWTFDVTQGSYKWNVSNFVVAWCNEGAVESVTIDPDPDCLKEWEYGGPFTDCPDGIKGIKVDLCDNPPSSFSVEIILVGLFRSDGKAEYLIKADNICTRGEVVGPSACTPIPEFSTIAIPIASILGLLFFFNHRKRRER